MRFYRKILIIAALIIPLNILAQPKDFNYINSKTNGFLVGTSFINENLPGNHNYHPIQFIYKFSRPLLKFKHERRSNLFINFEPQFNPVFISKAKNSFEFGLNVGFQYERKLSDGTIIFGGMGSGPHYISVETSLQSKGFIFSDNFIIGLRQLLKGNRPTELNIQIRFRHISNAGISEPNLGIDNFFIIFGLSRVFPRI